MGRVEVNIPDELEQRLRMLAVTQHGGKKGSLHAVLTDAIQQYVDADPVKNLKATARDKKATKGTRSGALKALTKEGRAGLVALTEVGSDGEMENWLREQAVSIASGQEAEREEEAREARLATVRAEAAARVRDRELELEGSRRGRRYL